MRASGLLIIILAACSLIIGTYNAGVVQGHEHRQVGNFELVVGWAVEPAFVGEKNGLDLGVTRVVEGQPASPEQEPPPVEGLEKTLKAEVIYGGQKRDLEVRGVFRRPGRYTSDVVPTKTGDYSFRVFGTIGQMKIDETFDSADGKFSEVEAIEAIHFPEKIPAPAEIIGQITQASTAVQQADQRAAAAQSAAASTRGLALLGLVAGVVGVVLGGFGLARASASHRHV